eukprot:scaffold59674_cov63-Phaeocystis_antarctica.AAC.2
MMPPDVGKPKLTYVVNASASKAPSQKAAPRPRAHMTSSHASRGRRSGGTVREMCAPAGMCAPVSTRASMTTRCRAMTPPGLSRAAETVASSWSTALGPSTTKSQSLTPAKSMRMFVRLSC